MNAVKARNPMPAQELGGLHIGRDHALFDQPVGIVTFDGSDALDLAVFV